MLSSSDSGGEFSDDNNSVAASRHSRSSRRGGAKPQPKFFHPYMNASEIQLVGPEDNVHVKANECLYGAGPNIEALRIGGCQEDVLKIVKAVRELPHHRGATAPMTCILNPLLERKIPKRATKCTLPKVNGYTYFSSLMKTSSVTDRMVAYLKERPRVAGMLEKEMTDGTSAKSFLPEFIKDLKEILGDTNHLTQLVVKIYDNLEPYTMLCCNC